MSDPEWGSEYEDIYSDGGSSYQDFDGGDRTDDFGDDSYEDFSVDDHEYEDIDYSQDDVDSDITLDG
jgi:hypothetical protein